MTRISIVAIGDSTTAGTPGFRSPREAPPHGSGDPRSQYAYWLMESHPWIRAQACGDPRIVFVDTRAAVAAIDNPDTLSASPDALHPDIDGYRRMAEAIAPGISRALRH